MYLCIKQDFTCKQLTNCFQGWKWKKQVPVFPLPLFPFLSSFPGASPLPKSS